MTPSQLRSLRIGLGLSAEGFARVLRVSGYKTVQRWEAGIHPIPGPVIIIAELLRDDPAVRLRLLPPKRAGKRAPGQVPAPEPQLAD